MVTGHSTSIRRCCLFWREQARLISTSNLPKRIFPKHVKELASFKSDETLIFADSLQVGPFPALKLGLPSMAALAADVSHRCNPTSEVHLRRSRNIPAFKLQTLLNVI